MNRLTVSTTRLPPGRTARDDATDVAYAPFAGFPATLVEDALQRLVNSQAFRRSVRHRRFMEHVVRAALGAQLADLKEVVIGLEVFGRSLPQYDPRSDPIVRVEAGRIREKLARYYAIEGAADPYRIDIPVGGYLPRIVQRSAGRPAIRSLGSIAVMPFASLSGAGDEATFCIGLTNQVIDALSRVPGLRVVGRMSSAKARARNLDLQATARLLGVTSILDGSVQTAGSRRRCITQLYRIKDGVCIWSERFESENIDGAATFALQDQVTDAVTATVTQPRIAEARSSRPIATRGTASAVSARDLYERARYLIQLRKTEGLEKAIALLEKAIAIEPDFAPAHSQLGIAQSAYFGILALPTLPAFREVERSARRALELDPLDGDAHALIANIVFRVERDWPSAEPMFREALRVAPNAATAHLHFASALAFNGRYLEAMEHAAIGVDLDPLNLTMRMHLAIVAAYVRDYAAAIRDLEAVLDTDGEHVFVRFMLGSVHLWAGEADAAMVHFEEAHRIAPDHPIPRFNRIMVMGLRGERVAGRRMLEALIAELAGTRYQLYNRAMAEAYLGDGAAMCATLRRSAEARELLFISSPADPSFDPYRDDPAFVALMDDYGLPRLPASPFAAAPAVAVAVEAYA